MVSASYLEYTFRFKFRKEKIWKEKFIEITNISKFEIVLEVFYVVFKDNVYCHDDQSLISLFLKYFVI